MVMPRSADLHAELGLQCTCVLVLLAPSLLITEALNGTMGLLS